MKLVAGWRTSLHSDSELYWKLDSMDSIAMRKRPRNSERLKKMIKDKVRYEHTCTKEAFCTADGDEPTAKNGFVDREV